MRLAVFIGTKSDNNAIAITGIMSRISQSKKHAVKSLNTQTAADQCLKIRHILLQNWQMLRLLATFMLKSVLFHGCSNNQVGLVAFFM